MVNTSTHIQIAGGEDAKLQPGEVDNDVSMARVPWAPHTWHHRNGGPGCLLTAGRVGCYSISGKDADIVILL